MNKAWKAACAGVAIAVAMVGVGCGDDAGGEGSGGSGGTGGSSGAGAGAGQFEDCMQDTDCQSGAICREGDICTGSLTDAPFEQECTEPQACPGGLCIGLLTNAQGKEGICSMPCGEDPSDCGDGAVCVNLSGNDVCLALCETNDDCEGGFVCVDDPEGQGKACLVETASS